MSLLYIGQQITLYSGFFLLIAGVVSNGINISVFSSVAYRRIPCTFYFLIASIYNIVTILMVIPSRIAASGYGVDLTRTSVSWCKMRQFIGTVCTITSLACTCLATIDQFLATSQKADLRRLSNIKLAHRIVVIVSIFWLLYDIPILIFYDISPITKSCGNTDYVYNIFSYPIQLLGFLCVIPCSVVILFGYLAYRNIQQTIVLAQQQADRQLIRMIFVETALVIISYAPFGINTAYNLITVNVSKDPNRLSIEGLATTIFSMMIFIYYSGSCYMFLISSSRFRRAAKSRILFCLRLNHVTPTQVPTDAAIILQVRTGNQSKI